MSLDVGITWTAEDAVCPQSVLHPASPCPELCFPGCIFYITELPLSLHPGPPLHFFSGTAKSLSVAAHCHSYSVALLPAQAHWRLGIHFPLSDVMTGERCFDAD